MVGRLFKYLVKATLSMVLIGAYAGEVAGNSFFFDHPQSDTSIELPKVAQQRQQAQRARMNSDDRARLLRQGFACDKANGRMGQANCTEQEEAAKRELTERTRRNHEIAKERMGL